MHIYLDFLTYLWLQDELYPAIVSWRLLFAVLSTSMINELGPIGWPVSAHFVWYSVSMCNQWRKWVGGYRTAWSYIRSYHSIGVIYILWIYKNQNLDRVCYSVVIRARSGPKHVVFSCSTTYGWSFVTHESQYQCGRQQLFSELYDCGTQLWQHFACSKHEFDVVILWLWNKTRERYFWIIWASNLS